MRLTYDPIIRMFVPMAHEIGPPDTPPVPPQSERFELARVDILHKFRVGFDRAPVGHDWVKMVGPKSHQRFVMRSSLFLGIDSSCGGQFLKYDSKQQFFDANGHTTYQYVCASRPHSVLVRQIQLRPAADVTETKDERTPGRSIFVARNALSGKWITAFVSDPPENLTMGMICDRVNLAGADAGMITPNQGFAVVVDGRMPWRCEIVKRNASAPMTCGAKRARWDVPEM